jgi:hypothetical protein
MRLVSSDRGACSHAVSPAPCPCVTSKRHDQNVIAYSLLQAPGSDNIETLTFTLCVHGEHGGRMAHGGKHLRLTQAADRAWEATFDRCVPFWPQAPPSFCRFAPASLPTRKKTKHSYSLTHAHAHHPIVHCSQTRTRTRLCATPGLKQPSGRVSKRRRRKRVSTPLTRTSSA